MRRPLTSTLFPYTTLFRSISMPDTAVQTASATRELTYIQAVNEALRWALAEYPEALFLDRKSTRLNSSHSSSSYAVFCLKKKNTEHTSPLYPSKLSRYVRN